MMSDTVDCGTKDMVQNVRSMICHHDQVGADLLCNFEDSLRGAARTNVDNCRDRQLFAKCRQFLFGVSDYTDRPLVGRLHRKRRKSLNDVCHVKISVCRKKCLRCTQKMFGSFA